MPVPDRGTENSDRSIVVACAAWALLGCLVVGAPLGLACVIGWPLSGMHLPAAIPRDPLTLHSLARFGALLAWGLWAQFTASVAVEIRSVRSGTQEPPHVRRANISRVLARSLVVVALTTTVSATTLTGPSLASVTVSAAGAGALAHTPIASVNGGATSSASTTLTKQAVNPPTASASTASADMTTQSTAALKFYLVQPPRGRHTDSLWDIAQRYLGGGRRYEEIYALNVGRLQPDGSQLQRASVIRPGWILALPGDAQGPGLTDQIPTPYFAPGATRISQPTQSGPVSSPNLTQTPAITPANGAAPQAPNFSGLPSKTHTVPTSSAGALTTTGAHNMPHPVASRPAVTPPQRPGQQPPDEGSTLQSIADVLPYVALIGSPVLAMALLAALTKAARRYRRERPPAAHAAPPDPAVAEVERTIRAAASCDTVDLVDRALRILRAATEANGRISPGVRHARADPEALYLTLDEPDLFAPTPWTALPDAHQWRFERSDPTPAPPGRHPVPYPLLLCIGALGDEQILVNLEAAPGRCTAVTGPSRQRRAVLAAAAATLGAAPWADQVRIESVGLPAELALLAPQRLRVHHDLAAALTALETDAAATGPHLVRLLVAENVPPGALSRLRTLTGEDRSTTALVGVDRSLADVPVISVDQVGRLRVPGISGELAASRLPDALAAALGALFRSTTAPRQAPVHRPADAPLPGGLELLDSPVGVRASILGPVELVGVRPVDAARGPLFTEALALLLFHRAGLPAAVFARALWPRGITPVARDRMLSDLCAWLGDGPTGARLALGPANLIRLSDDVRSDWDEFQAAYREADLLSLDRPEAADSALARALGLVRGELLADRPPGRYSWLGFGTQETEVPALIADAAHRLASRRLRAGDHAAAQWAAHQGLLGAPDDERLVQIEIRAIAEEGDRDQLYSAVADLKVRAWRRYGETDLHPATNAVVAELTGQGV